MSKYTAELREYFEQYQTGGMTNRTLIEEGRTHLFDFDYPIYDTNYRKVFETHFIRKFYMREIGFETFGLFKFQLETWLLINMPYFNKLFESELIQYDPLTNVKFDLSHTKRNDKTQNDTSSTNGNKTSQLDASKSGTTNGTSNSNTEQTHTGNATTNTSATKSEDTTETEDDFNRELESDNPDTRLALTATDGEGVIEYASKIKEQNTNNNKTQNSNGSSTNNTSSETNATDNVDSTQTTTATSSETDNTEMNENDTRNNTLTSTINDFEDYIENQAGKLGVQTFPEMIQKYRQSFLRVENQIFNEMQELFMLTY